MGQPASTEEESPIKYFTSVSQVAINNNNTVVVVPGDHLRLKQDELIVNQLD